MSSSSMGLKGVELGSLLLSSTILARSLEQMDAPQSTELLLPVAFNLNIVLGAQCVLQACYKSSSLSKQAWHPQL